MKAVVNSKYGSPDILRYVEVEKPTPGDREVLVQIRAASVNSWDADVLKGSFFNRLLYGPLKSKIKVLGCDIAGVVEAVGKDAKQFQPGDEVFGDLSSCGWGGFAEFVAARENALAIKPSSMTFEDAASIPQAALLATQGLLEKGKIQAGQKVLINGAGGGAGTFAVQIAKAYGAVVTGVDSTSKLDTMLSIGADYVIDYTQEDFTKNGQSYDLILDNAAYHSTSDYRRALSPNGIYVSTGGSTPRIFQTLLLGAWFSLIGGKKLGILAHKPNKGLDTIIELFEAGKVTPVIDRRYPLSEVSEALLYFMEGDVKGKIVINI